MFSKQELSNIVECCVARFGRGQTSTWKNSDFNDLSRVILRETKILISPSTLKRIFGKVAVEDDYLPQQATLDALKKYGGYVERNKDDDLTPDSSEGKPAEKQLPSRKKKTRIILIFISVIATVIIVGGLLIYHNDSTQSQASINLKTTEGQLPVTALFGLKMPETSDSLFVDFGDKTAPAFVLPGENSVAHNYLIPGVFRVAILKRNQVIAKTKISILSNEWIGVGFRRQHDMREHFYRRAAEKTGADSLFHISNKQLAKTGLDTSGFIITRLSNFTRLKNIDNSFVFETTFKNDFPAQNNYCRSTQFQISGIDNFIRFKLASPGCSFYVLNILGEQTFSGQQSNLSKFVFDLHKWIKVKLINNNKSVTLYVNNKMVFKGKYHESLGEIQGVFLEFEGTGAVRNCDIKTIEGKTLLHF